MAKHRPKPVLPVPKSSPVVLEPETIAQPVALFVAEVPRTVDQLRAARAIAFAQLQEQKRAIQMLDAEIAQAMK